MKQRPITTSRYRVCREVSKLNNTHLSLQTHAASPELELHIKGALLELESTKCPSSTRETFVSFRSKKEESVHTWNPGWPTRRSMNLSAPLYHTLLRVQGHKDNLMCMDFLLTIIRLSGGAAQAVWGSGATDDSNWNWQRVEHNDSVDNNNHNYHANHSSSACRKVLGKQNYPHHSPHPR